MPSIYIRDRDRACLPPARGKRLIAYAGSGNGGGPPAAASDNAHCANLKKRRVSSIDGVPWLWSDRHTRCDGALPNVFARINFLFSLGLLILIAFYFAGVYLLVLPLSAGAPGWVKPAAGVAVLAAVGLTVQLLSMAMSSLRGIALYAKGERPGRLAFISQAAMIAGHIGTLYAASVVPQGIPEAASSTEFHGCARCRPLTRCGARAQSMRHVIGPRALPEAGRRGSSHIRLWPAASPLRCPRIAHDATSSPARRRCRPGRRRRPAPIRS